MKKEECYIGMRVICPSSMDGWRRFGGHEGTVVAIYGDDRFYEVAVEFDEDVDGHDCRGAAKHGHGYFGYFRDIEPLDEIVPQITMSFDQLMDGG